MTYHAPPMRDYSGLLRTMRHGVHDCRAVPGLDHPYLVVDKIAEEVIGARSCKWAKRIARQLASLHKTLLEQRDNKCLDHPRIT